MTKNNVPELFPEFGIISTFCILNQTFLMDKDFKVLTIVTV